MRRAHLPRIRVFLLLCLFGGLMAVILAVASRVQGQVRIGAGPWALERTQQLQGVDFTLTTLPSGSDPNREAWARWERQDLVELPALPMAMDAHPVEIVERPFGWASLLGDVVVRLGLGLTGTLLLLAGVVAVRPIQTGLEVGQAPAHAVPSSDTARPTQAPGLHAGTAPAPPTGQASVAEEDPYAPPSGVGVSQHLPQPTVQGVPASDQAPPGVSQPGQQAKPATWEPQPTTAGTHAPQGPDGQPQDPLTQPAPRQAQPNPAELPQSAPALNGDVIGNQSGEESGDLSAEEILNDGVLADLFETEVEESASRQVLIRDLAHIDMEELALEAQTLASALVERA